MARSVPTDIKRLAFGIVVVLAALALPGAGVWIWTGRPEMFLGWLASEVVAVLVLLGVFGLVGLAFRLFPDKD
jgi:hypothetical protein